MFSWCASARPSDSAGTGHRMETKGTQGTCRKKPGSVVIATREGPVKENKCLGQKLQFYTKACSGEVTAARWHTRPASSRCLHPANLERDRTPHQGLDFPLHVPLHAAPAPAAPRAEVHLGLSSSGSPKHAGRAWITPCPIQGPCLLLAMLFCKH